MINKIEDYIYFIYQGISKQEMKGRNNYELLNHDNEMYLLIGYAPSKEKAMLAIESYWEAILHLE